MVGFATQWDDAAWLPLVVLGPANDDGLPRRQRLAVEPVQRWQCGRGLNSWRSWGGGEAWRARGARPARGSRRGWRIAVTFQVFGSQVFGADQDAA